MKGEIMLKINLEFRKGILFIRLKGSLNKLTYQSMKDYLIPIIKDNGIKYIVFNLAYLTNIDGYGKESIKEAIFYAKQNQGTGLICNSKISFDKPYTMIENELKALKYITI